MNRPYSINQVFTILFVLVFSLPVLAAETDENSVSSFFSELPIEMHGFYEMRSGFRLRKDKYEKDMSIMENRLQLDLSSYPEWGDLKVKGDVFGDLVTEQGDFDLREANMFLRPNDFLDLKKLRPYHP